MAGGTARRPTLGGGRWAVEAGGRGRQLTAWRVGYGATLHDYDVRGSLRSFQGRYGRLHIDNGTARRLASTPPVTTTAVTARLQRRHQRDVMVSCCVDGHHSYYMAGVRWMTDSEAHVTRGRFSAAHQMHRVACRRPSRQRAVRLEFSAGTRKNGLGM